MAEPDRGAIPRGAGRAPPSLLPLLIVAAQLSAICWATPIAADATPGALLALVFAIGLGSGIFGLLAAHELIHCRNRAQNALGMLMLTAVTYRHFRTAHLHGHHRWAVTSRDPGTARRGESAYAFLRRSIIAQLCIAYGYGGPGSPPCPGRRHRLRADLLIYASIYASLAGVLGSRAVAFHLGQSLVAITVLGLFDYVAHYGLSRRPRPGGGHEPMSDLHSWNAEGRLANLLLLNMGHHSDHHRRPAEPGRCLASIADTPRLPGGYAGAILTALVPPLWRRRMDPLATHWGMRTPSALSNVAEHRARSPK